MPMSKQDAINQMLSLQQKKEVTEEDKKKIAELQSYIQAQAPGKSGFGKNTKDQMSELEY